MNLKSMLAAMAVFGAAIALLVFVTRWEEKRAVPDADVLPAHLFMSERPASVSDIAEVRKTAKVGDRVAVRGRIGGSKSPFVAGRAVFLLMDVNVPNCIENHNPGCPTPWDFCCAPREQRLAGAATVQVVGTNGLPLKAALEGEGGLSPLRQVVVEGNVLQTADGLVIGATTLYVPPQ